ncbi:MAG: hypothetical protein HXX20_16655 [Chloroflexi bacterium]|nr:hypothetical protein [Chloroflexota bacterium]
MKLEEELRVENANLKAQVADLKAPIAQLSEKLTQVQAQSAHDALFTALLGAV